MPAVSPCPRTGFSFRRAASTTCRRCCARATRGGILETSGTVEVVSSIERDGRPVYRDLRWGVYVVVEAPNDYTAACFRQYGMKTDSSGRFAALYRPYHLIGLELGISVLSAALRGEPTGATRDFRGDPVATAKRDLKAGETLDGEGGYTVWGKLWPAAKSLAHQALPIGLAHGVKLTRDVKAGEAVRWPDVVIGDNQAVSLRREAEAMASGALTIRPDSPGQATLYSVDVSIISIDLWPSKYCLNRVPSVERRCARSSMGGRDGNGVPLRSLCIDIYVRLAAGR